MHDVLMYYQYGFTYYIFAVVQNCLSFIFKQNIWNISPTEQFKLYFNYTWLVFINIVLL